MTISFSGAVMVNGTLVYIDRGLAKTYGIGESGKWVQSSETSFIWIPDLPIAKDTNKWTE